MEDDGPPDLQDFEQELKQIKKNQPQKTVNMDDYTKPNIRHIEDQKQKQRLILETNKAAQNLEKKIEPIKEKSGNGGFGGMKKGFFSSKPEPNKPKVTQIKPVNKNKNPLEIKQVQDAMQMNDYLTNTRDKWMDNNFLDQVSNSSKISKLFTNPQYMQAITMFQKNPQQAMIKYGQNKQLMQCFQQFCKLMGMQFTKLSQQQKAKNK